jgi:hypothetical protein
MVDRRLDIVYVRGIGFRGEEIMRSFQAHEALHHCQLYAKICVFVKHTKFYSFVKHANLFVISNDDFTQNFVSCRIVTLEYPSHCYNSNLLHFELQVLHCSIKLRASRCSKELWISCCISSYKFCCCISNDGFCMVTFWVISFALLHFKLLVFHCYILSYKFCISSLVFHCCILSLELFYYCLSSTSCVGQ